MLFNSLEFVIFLPIVFLLYWFVINKSLQRQNLLLLFASYYFYGWWDWRFLFLLVSISIFNYFVGIRIDKNEADKKKKIWLLTGLIINIGILGIFKYYNFFIDSFINVISFFGYNLPKSTTKIILPLGISFYTFLSISYIIDIYKQNLKANRNIVEVLLTLSFFPIILAGPIQRPSSLLPQITKRRDFDLNQTVDGLRQILWGFFSKVVIADNLASQVDNIFSNYSEASGSTLALGAVFYAIQIYADFSGYSNMAIGIARLFGFSLMRNFAYPYFSRDITEFWKRWHISLTTWFRDYLFRPFSFTIATRIKNERVFFIKIDLFIYLVTSIITWFLIGLWHGANYTFIIWGMIHGSFLIIYQWQKMPRKRLFKKAGIKNDHPLVILIETIFTITIVVLAWVFFRADNIHQACAYISNIFSASLFVFPQVSQKKVIIIAMIFLLIEWFQRDKQHGLQIENIKNRTLRWALYYAMILIILYFAGAQEKFIYFQF